MALWFVALASVGLAVAALEQINVMCMLSLSEAYTTANAAEREPFQALRIVVVILYTVLFRFALVPRALAAFGLAAVLLLF